MINNISNKWMKKYEYAHKYYEKHGNLLVPKDYEITDDGTVIRLGYWINTQRNAYRKTRNNTHKLNEKQIELLNNIGMIWSFKLVKEDIRKEYTSDKWMMYFSLAKAYYENYGNLLVHRDYTVDVNGEVIRLGCWINSQRFKYSKNGLNDKKVKLLNSIGMVWNLSDYKENNDYISDIWMRNYLSAKKYYETYGNLLVNESYVVDSGAKQINLAKWIDNQRSSYKSGKLNKKQIELLNELSMVWYLREYKKHLKEIDLNKENKKYEDDVKIDNYKNSVL